MALPVKWAGIEYSLGACDTLTLQDCNLAACSVALLQYLKLIESFFCVSSVGHKEAKHVVGVLKKLVFTKTIFSLNQVGLDYTALSNCMWISTQ